MDWRSARLLRVATKSRRGLLADEQMRVLAPPEGDGAIAAAKIVLLQRQFEGAGLLRLLVFLVLARLRAPVPPGSHAIVPSGGTAVALEGCAAARGQPVDMRDEQNGARVLVNK